jgi:hypothetical protein
MGLLNLPFSFFSSLDRLMRGGLTPFAALVAWGVVAAVLSMLLYRMVSSQGAISQSSAEAARARRALLLYDGDLDGMRGLVVEALGRSARQLRLTLVPAVIASLPLLSLMAWLSLAYGYGYPAPGSEVRVETVPPAAGIVWEPAAERDGQQGLWRVAWPASGEQLRLLDTRQREILSIPPSAPVTVFHKRQWWNAILEHPIGYIPEDAALDLVELDLPPAVFVEIGPAWARGWEATFFSVLVLCSLAIKLAFRIK